MAKIKDPVLRKAYNKVQREYSKEKYHSEPKYKKRVLMATKKWRKNNRKKYNEYMRNYMKRRRNHGKD